MPLALVIIGIALLVSALRNTQGELGSLLASDAVPYLKWAAAIAVIGALGYVEDLRPLSRALLGLVILVIFLGTGGSFFSKLNEAIQNPARASSAKAAADTTYGPIPVQVTGGSSSGGSSALNTIFGAASKLAMFA